MKVLLINGSPRKSGNTSVALEEVAKTLRQEGVETEIVWIGNKPVRGCIACGRCKTGEKYADGHVGCVFNDDICNRIAEKYQEADGFVFGSPVYYGQPNGALLSIMQRSFFSNGAAVQNKPAAVVAICRRGGATAAFQCMNMPLQMMNMPVVSSQYWNIAYGREEGQAALDKEGMQTMRTLAHNMAWMLRGLKAENAPAVPEREEWQPMNFIR
ncbi:MAG: flavodoxin family protein [Paludibacteraceae bacterium]|nr:flavodoxin family protein [Paludibacteraceae bacterium]